MYYTLSYDLHNTHKHKKTNYSDKLREYVCLLLIGLHCTNIRRHSGSTIHFNSTKSFENIVKIFSENFNKNITLSIDEVVTTPEGKINHYLHAPDKDIEDNFLTEIFALAHLTSDEFNAKLKENIKYFG